VRPHHRASVLGLLASATLGCSTQSSPSGPPPSGPALPVAPITHEGRWLTDAEGRVVLVHGVNVVNKNPPYYPSAEGFSDADATWLADNGFRVVRVGILATGLMPTPGVVDMGYVQQIVATVDDLAKHDIYSLIDLHQDGWGPSVGSDGFPAWMTLTGDAGYVDAGFPLYYEQDPQVQQAFQSFWDDTRGPGDAGLQDDYAAMFSAVATQLESEPYVLGYDLFNEPWPGTTWVDCLNDADGCPMLDQSELGPAYAKAVAAIRAAGDHHIVFGEPFGLFNFGVSTTSVPLPGGDSNAGMAFHVYPLTTNQAPDVIKNAVAWSSGTGGALLDGEWGATTVAETLTSESVALDSAFVPWIFWSFCCELVPSLSEAPGGSNLVSSTASVLVQPYPLAVAGTPLQLTFDPSAETLSFTWSTARAGGGTFATGTVTTIEAPALAYPNGYTATVTNGWITSTPCATLLTVAAKPGAATVTIDVQPGGACP
jgi:endoglycosylceramidase